VTSLWDNEGTPVESDEWWVDLTKEQRDAAETLGYNEQSWNGVRRKLEETNEGATEGYVAPPNPYADEDKRYRNLYIVAAWCFVMVGFLDWLLEGKLYPLLFVVAGLCGFVSALFVLSNIRVSNILDMCSVHFYFFEAIAMVWSRMRGEKQYHPFLIAADALFATGSTIEVVLSYFYVFDSTADFSVDIAAFNTLAQSLWVICALIYIAFTLKTRPAMKADTLKETRNDRKATEGPDSFCDGAVTY